MNETSILVAVCEDVAHIRVTGRADFAVATRFKTAFEALRHRGFHLFAIDLGDCLQMDSTFLGTLAGATMNLGCRVGGTTRPPIELFRPNKRLQKLLSDLGVDSLFSISTESDKAVDYEAAPPVRPTPTAMARTSLEAHEALMSISPKNRSRFKDVVSFLRDDLSKVAPNATSDHRWPDGGAAN